MKGSVLDPPRPAPPIDQRLRARRIEVRRSEGRRRLRRLLIALAVTAVVLVAWAATRSPLLDVDAVRVAGIENTSEAAVLAAVGISPGDALVDVDLDAAAAAVEALPWVRQADVSRSWGGEIRVGVVERRPIGVLEGTDGRRWLVDGGGRVLGEAPPGTDLPVVVGLNPVEPGARLDPLPTAVLDLLDAIPPVVADHTDAVEVDGERITLRLAPRPGEVDADARPRDEGGRVVLGDARTLDEQLLAAATVLTQVDLTDLVVLDVRAPSNPVVTRTAFPVGEEEEPS